MVKMVQIRHLNCVELAVVTSLLALMILSVNTAPLLDAKLRSASPKNRSADGVVDIPNDVKVNNVKDEPNIVNVNNKVKYAPGVFPNEAKNRKLNQDILPLEARNTSNSAKRRSKELVLQNDDSVKLRFKEAVQVPNPIRRDAGEEHRNGKENVLQGNIDVKESQVKVDKDENSRREEKKLSHILENQLDPPKEKPGFFDDDILYKKTAANDPLKFNPLKALASVVPLPLDDIRPPDHVEGVRMEHDGHLNKDYKKEILLGNHHEFDNSDDEKLTSRLKLIFTKADANRDGYLVQHELKVWIQQEVQEHLKEAWKETERIFDHLDADKDGFVTWKEFQTHFLLAKGYKLEKVAKFADDYDSLALDMHERERIIRYKFRWAEADEEPQDNRLTRIELRNFRHPEQNPTLISRMARDIIDNLDRDGDNIITEEEFVALPHAQLDQVAVEEQDKVWQEERRKEFRQVIDLDGNGKVDEAELKIYVDPHNVNHAQLEADNLMQLADEDHDGRLSLQEVLDNSELFFGSKVVNAGENFHDEF